MWQPCEHCELLYTRYLLTYLLTHTPTKHSPTLFTIAKQFSDLSWNMQARSGILASHLNSQKHSKQFNDELVKSSVPLLEVAHTAVTVLLLSWTAFILDVNSNPKKPFNQIVTKPENCLHYMLPTDREQSVTELSMGWVNPWVGLDWVTQNGPMDNSE